MSDRRTESSGSKEGPRQPEYVKPKGSVTYEDPYGVGKQYMEKPVSGNMKFEDLPITPEEHKTLTGSKFKHQPRSNVTWQSQHMAVPVTDESGERLLAHFHDVKYSVSGRPFTAKSDGSTQSGVMPFNQIPGMKKESGEFAAFSVPKAEQTRAPSDFSYFTKMPEKK